jgi:Protein of unknown function (DUF2946)
VLGKYRADWLMRQRLRTFLPIGLIALAVQILAPIASAWAAAIAASDPLRSVAICHSDSTSLPGQQPDQGADRRAQDGACSICCLALANAFCDAPTEIALAIPHLDAAPVVWRDEPSDLPQIRKHPHARARAPPHAT